MSDIVQCVPLQDDAAWPPNWRATTHSISSGRYIDPAFAVLEFERLWNRVWQAAARLDEIPEAGDYTVYEIGDQSVLLVRVDAATVKAYHNFCPHRGTALGEGCGKFEHDRIICPFHGWRWDLRGQVQYVLERQEFRNGELRDSDVALKEVSVALFAGFVFINLARDPAPFDEFIAPVRQLIEDLAIGDMHHYWWKEIAAPGNWKVAQEAFFESYHVPTTHPQLETAGADFIFGDQSGPAVDFSHHYHQYETFPHGHGRFFGGKKTPMAGHVTLPGDPVEMMAARLNLLVEGMDAMVLAEDVELVRSLKGKPIPEGSSLGGEYMKLLYSTAAAQNRPMPKPAPEVLDMWGGEIFVFPNLMILPQAGNAMIYRVRPHRTDPDRCIFEILSTKTYPAALAPPRATVEKIADPSDPEQLRLIPRQDLGNIPRMQRGLHSRGCKQIWLAKYYEQIILHMHQELDRYLLEGQ